MSSRFGADAESNADRTSNAFFSCVQVILFTQSNYRLFTQSDDRLFELLHPDSESIASRPITTNRGTPRRPAVHNASPRPLPGLAQIGGQRPPRRRRLKPDVRRGRRKMPEPEGGSVVLTARPGYRLMQAKEARTACS